MNDLRQMASEGDGQISSTRVALLAIVAVVLINWTGACWLPGKVQLISLPEPLVALIVGAMGAKAWQRGREA